ALEHLEARHAIGGLAVRRIDLGGEAHAGTAYQVRGQTGQSAARLIGSGVPMSELIVVAYPDRHRADEVLLELRKSERAHLVDLEDAAVVSKSPEGRVSLRQTQHLLTSGALGGGFWGLLIGALFMAPVLGAAVGAATGAVAGALADVGIDDEFM